MPSDLNGRRTLTWFVYDEAAGSVLLPLFLTWNASTPALRIKLPINQLLRRKSCKN